MHAFEPSSRNFKLLEANIALNHCRNVTANNLAVSNFVGKLSLHCDPLHPEYDGHFFVRSLAESAESATAMETVNCTTVDEYWREACGGAMEPVDFIVIDVEGAELSVFEGARATLAASPQLTIIMECTERIAEMDSLLRELGFSFFNLDANTAELIPAVLERGSVVALRGAPSYAEASGGRAAIGAGK